MVSSAGAAGSQTDLFALLPDASPLATGPADAPRAVIDLANPMPDNSDMPVFGPVSEEVSAAPQAPLADGKDPEAFRTIGEVAKALAIAPHVLRYWEEQLPAGSCRGLYAARGAPVAGGGGQGGAGRETDGQGAGFCCAAGGQEPGEAC